MDHAAQMLRRAAFAGVLVLLFLLHASFALGEVSLSFTPAAPRAGDYVDVVVDTGGEKAKEIRCRLTLDGGKVFSGKMPEIHTAASFRPRKEGMYTLEVTVKLAGNRTEAASVSIPVSGAAPDRYGADVVYSQQDGWWSQHLYTGTYRHTLDSSGCAIFTLSHALQRMGLAGEEILPDRLARVYGGYYTEGLGARTEALITQADLRFGFGTAHAPVTAEDEIISFLRRGDLFTLGIVRHHVVLADAVDVEHRKVHIVDSSPGTTFSRLRPTPPISGTGTDRGRSSGLRKKYRESDGFLKRLHTAGPDTGWTWKTALPGGCG